MIARVTLALLVVVLGLLQYRLWVSPDGVCEVWRLDEAVDAQRSSNEVLVERNARLDAEVQDLREGLESVEERARNELGMVRESESFFQVIEGTPIQSRPAE